MAVIWRRLGQHQTHFFTLGRNLVNEVDRRIFQRACEVAGITNFKFYDLRHMWASWHVQRGTPLMELKELGGWETIELVQKYAHLGKAIWRHTPPMPSHFGHSRPKKAYQKQKRHLSRWR